MSTYTTDDLGTTQSLNRSQLAFEDQRYNSGKNLKIKAESVSNFQNISSNKEPRDLKGPYIIKPTEDIKAVLIIPSVGQIDMKLAQYKIVSWKTVFI